MEKDYLDLARRRFSVWRFDQRPVEDEKLDKVLEAGRIAPSACNFQPIVVYVVQSPESLARLRQATRMAFDAPVVLAVCCDLSRVYHNRHETLYEDYTTREMDASIACDQMMMEATDLGLGTLWARGYDTRAVAEALGTPDGVVPVCLLDLGYPAEGVEPSHHHGDRRPLDQMVVRI